MIPGIGRLVIQQTRGWFVWDSWNSATSGPPSLTIGGNEALIWDMYNWVDEVNLTTGSGRMFTQLPHGDSPAGHVTDVAW